MSTLWRKEIAALGAHARDVVMGDVTAADAPIPGTLSARTVARILSWIVHALSARDGMDGAPRGVAALVVPGRCGMQAAERACADLVRCDLAWSTRFGHLPVTDGVVPEPVSILATASPGLLRIRRARRA